MVLVLLISLATFAQKTVVPPTVVKAAFEKKYPGATGVEWGKESKTEYEAEFTLNGSKMAANFSAAGKWVVTETAMQLTDMPQAVQDAIKTKKASSIKLAEKVEKPGKAISYEIEYLVGKQTKEVVLSASGKEINAKAEKEEKD